MSPRVSAVGFAVGLLVGLTGMGGGAVMTPLLILLGWAKPAGAVGTDLLWGAATKAVGAFVHYRQHTVDLMIVRRLALGSIPGAIVGLTLLAHMRTRGGDTVDRVVIRLLAITLICVAVSLFVRSFVASGRLRPGEGVKDQERGWVTSLAGGCIGILVSLTSVGSGSLIVACLVILYPATPLRRIVGSDIFHGPILLGVSALGHLEVGSIDTRLAAGLLAGSIPGVWLGSRMSGVLPERLLRPILGGTLLFFGYKLL